jgi:tetratricopeptide (TPR) repeat protein
MKSKYIAILGLSISLCLSSVAGAQDKAAAGKAAEHLQKGRIAYDLQDWPAAIQHFQEAYRIAQQPPALWALAQSQRQSGDCTAAIQSYKSFRRAEVTADQVAAADKMIGQCEEQLAKAREAAKAAPPSETTQEKDKPEPEHAEPGQPATPAPEPERSPIPLYIAGGATLLLAAGAVVTGLIAHDKASEYKSANESPTPNSRGERESLRQDAQQMQIFNAALIGAAVVGAGITAYLALSSPSEAPAGQARRARLRVAPWLGPAAGGLAAGGSF